MSLELVMGVVGVIVTILVIVGMILITPGGTISSRSIAESRGVERAAPPTAAENQPIRP
jgi:hypothetical protein